MKAQFRFGLNLSWSRATAVFLADVAVLALASRWPQAWQTEPVAWWVGVAVAAVVTMTGVVTYRGITVPAALGGWVWDWSADPEKMLAAGCTPAIDHQRRFGRDVVGVRQYRGQLVAAIAVDAEATSGRHRHPAESSITLPVETVAAGLRQFETRLDGIDIVSVGTWQAAAAVDSSAPNDSKTSLERRGVGNCSTWVVLRMDPNDNVAAVAARDSVASTLAAATERVAQSLDGRYCAARPLTADDLAELDSAVLAGLQPTWSRPGWRHLKHFNGYATSFWVSPQDIASETLHQLWLADTDATVVTIRLTAHADRSEVSAWVRYHSDDRLPKAVWTGLNRLTGRQLAAVRASLPAPARRPLLVVPTRPLDHGEELSVPMGTIREGSLDSVG